MVPMGGIMQTYKTSGTCAREIKFKIEDDLIKEIEFVSGCPGNLIGIQSLVKGAHIDEVIDKLKGVPCGSKTTSCPDQLALALEEYKANK